MASAKVQKHFVVFGPLHILQSVAEAKYLEQLESHTQIGMEDHSQDKVLWHASMLYES